MVSGQPDVNDVYWLTKIDAKTAEAHLMYTGCRTEDGRHFGFANRDYVFLDDALGCVTVLIREPGTLGFRCMVYDEKEDVTSETVGGIGTPYGFRLLVEKLCATHAREIPDSAFAQFYMNQYRKWRQGVDKRMEQQANAIVSIVSAIPGESDQRSTLAETLALCCIM